MRTVSFLLVTALLLISGSVHAQQMFRLPDLSRLKHITTRDSDHAVDIPGKETVMEFYAGRNGQVYTVYSYRGRTIAFSTHSNSDYQKTYRLYMDLNGDRLFQQVSSNPTWQVPRWAR